jgi:hypothetical protein
MFFHWRHFSPSLYRWPFCGRPHTSQNRDRPGITDPTVSIAHPSGMNGRRATVCESQLHRTRAFEKASGGGVSSRVSTAAARNGGARPATDLGRAPIPPGWPNSGACLRHAFVRRHRLPCATLPSFLTQCQSKSSGIARCSSDRETRLLSRERQPGELTQFLDRRRSTSSGETGGDLTLTESSRGLRCH